MPLQTSEVGTSPGAASVSVIIPTYNRLPILTKCLNALEAQELSRGAHDSISKYEVIVVDDGSSDATVEYLRAHAADFPHVRVLTQEHGGAAAARNMGVMNSTSDVVVFIDSDLVVGPTFLREHAAGLQQAYTDDGDDIAFTYGRVVNTDNFDDPTSEPFKFSDLSAAFFATGNVAISRRRLLAVDTGAGPFDTEFSEYGWEDLELGERLRATGVRIVQCPAAVGFHYHPAFAIDQLPSLISQEKQRGRNGVRFFMKHPNFNVRLMVQMTPFHFALWALLTLFGSLNENTLRPLLSWLLRQGHSRSAMGLISPILNWHNIQATRSEAAKHMNVFQSWLP